MNRKVDFQIISNMVNPSYGRWIAGLHIDDEYVRSSVMVSRRPIPAARPPFWLSKNKTLFIKHVFFYGIDTTSIIEDYRKYGGKNATD